MNSQSAPVGARSAGTVDLQRDETGAPHPAAAGIRGEHYRLIDAVRGFACLMVLLFHSLVAHPPEQLHPALRAATHVTGDGWLHVYTFFAISGWCIAERWHLAARRGESPGHFLADRMLRIFPVYWCAVLFALGLRVAASFFNRTTLASNLPDGWAGWIGTALLIDPYVGTKPYVDVSWSLVYEVGFYVTCAAGLWALVRLRLAPPVLLAIGAALSVLATLAGPANPWFVLGLWPHFFAGVAAWCATHSSPRWAGYAALLGLFALAHFAPHANSTTLHTATLAALLLSLLHRFDARLSALPGMRHLMALGVVSYSVYLLHVPVMSAWQNLAARWVAPSSALFVPVWLGGIALALAISWLFARAVEMPLLRWRRRLLA